LSTASPKGCGLKREPVLVAWGFTVERRRVLLHLMAGSKEDAETVTAFFEDMKRRGLNDPLLVTSDGAPGIIKAIEVRPRTAEARPESIGEFGVTRARVRANRGSDAENRQRRPYCRTV
jgi:hypothetical protein